MKHLSRTIVACVLTMSALLFATAPRPAAAVDLIEGKIDIHGFGHQGYLLTSHNKWLDADNRGSFNFNNLGLLVSAHPSDDLSIWTQIFADDEASSIRMDWAFVDYKFSDELRVRAGQVRDPLGLLGEIRDIKYLQLSTIKPYIYQDEVDIVPKAYRGAGITYAPDLLNGDLTIDLFGGAPVFTEGEGSQEDMRNLVGGRFNYKTPIEGLSVMGSFMTAKEKRLEEGAEHMEGKQNLYMGSLLYDKGNLDLRGEYAYIQDIHERKFGYYAQAGYTFFQKLTPFVRWDYITTLEWKRSDPSFYQKDLVVGVDYKFNSNVAFKVENHFINGYAMPVARETGETDADGNEITEMAPGSGRTHWNLFAASLNFIF